MTFVCRSVRQKSTHISFLSDPESIKDAETLNQNNNVKGVTFSLEVPYNEEDLDDDDGECFLLMLFSDNVLVVQGTATTSAASQSCWLGSARRTCWCSWRLSTRGTSPAATRWRTTCSTASTSTRTTQTPATRLMSTQSRSQSLKCLKGENCNKAHKGRAGTTAKLKC